MKRLPCYEILMMITVLIIFPFVSNGQVYVWNGQSPDWSNLSNWSTQDGGAIKNLPGSDAHVLISAEYNGDIMLPSGSFTLSSLSYFGEGNISFQSPSTSTLILEGSLNLGSNVSADDEVSFELQGSGYSNPVYSLSPQIESNVTSIADNYQQQFISNDLRGACPFFDLTPNPTSPTCNGFEDGIAAVLEPTTGVGPYIYQWIGGPDTPEWTNVGAGTYTIIVIDVGQGGLPCNTDVFVNEPGPLTLFSITEVPPTCFNSCDGQAIPIVIGGNPGYTLTWSSGETGITPIALCETFTLNIEDTQGCTADTTITFTNVPTQIAIAADVTDLTCFGFDDGSIDVTASGGTGLLNYSWTGPNGFNSIAEDISSLEPGDYTVDVVDQNGCTESATYTILENPELLLSTTVTPNVCAGESLGEVDLTIAGGLAPYDVSWTGPLGFTSTSEDITGLIAGTYEATVTDAAGCVVVIQADVIDPLALTATIDVTNLLCFEDNSGELQASASGGTPGYNYAWTGPNGFVGSGPSLILLPAGTYNLTVTDINNCEFTTSVDVLQPDELGLSFVETPVSCNGDFDGEIDLTVTGGTPPYGYSWTGPGAFSSTDEDILGLGNGEYFIEVTDANGCIINGSYDLVEPLPITLTASIIDPSCAGFAEGEIDLTITNGTPPYITSWTGPNGFTSSDEDIVNLEAGTYTVEVTDAGGCTEGDTYVINAPSTLLADLTVTDASCFGGSDGSIATTVSGGTAPYNFSWTGPGGYTSTDQNPTGLLAGDYTLTVTDANGCSDSFMATVGEPTDLIVNEIVTDVLCFGGVDGAIDITVSGATPPYNFAWTGPNAFVAGTQNIAGLEAGSYDLEVTDGNLCVFNFTIDVVQPDELTLAFTESPITCSGDLDGEIDLTVAGGTPPYGYSWTGPNAFTSTDEDIVGLGNGTYSIEVTDANGCVVNGNYDLIEPLPITLLAIITNPVCVGGAEGAIQLTVNNGALPLTISWTGPNGFSSSDEDISSLLAGSYTVDVTDAGGCIQSETYTISDPAPLVANFDVTDVSCFGGSDGSITTTTTGGTAPFSFDWAGPGGFNSADQNPTGLIAGVYTLTLADANGCSDVFTATVNEPTDLVVTEVITDVTCFSEFDGTIDITLSGATPPYSFAWTGPNAFAAGTQNIAGLEAGTYDLEVTDANLCVFNFSYQVDQPNEIVITGIITNVLCAGEFTGAIDITVSGGSPGFDYVWTGPNSFTSVDEDLSGLEAGVYTVVVTGADGCTETADFEIIEGFLFTLSLDGTNISCFNANDGEIDATISGGNPPYTISWTGPGGFTSSNEDIFSLLPGVYNLEVTDANGCAAVDQLEIIEPGEILNTLVSTNIDCFGDNNGTITINPTGGTPPYNFAWIGPNGFTSTDQNLSGLAPGDYSVVIQDQNGCFIGDGVTIIEGDDLVLSTSITDSNCLQADGLAVGIASGGTGILTYSWFDENGTFLVSNDSLIDVVAGIYEVVVVDELGCSASEVVEISDNNGTLTGAVTPPTCAGDNDGTITTQLVGGTAPFNYQWSDINGPFSNAQNLTDLTAGEYTLTVTDANNCLFSEVFQVVDPLVLLANETFTQISCAGSDGTIALSVQNAQGDFTVTWTGPNGFTDSGTSLSNLDAGEYIYSIVDDAGCTAGGSVIIDEASPISISETSTDILCAGDASGTIDVEATGGLLSLDYQWTGPENFTSNDEDLTGLIAGEYILVVTDQSSCSETITVNILEPDSLQAQIIVNQPDCSSSNGSLEAIVTGGVVATDYQITWLDDQGLIISNSNLLENLESGVFTFIVMDDNGCEYTETVTLTNPDGDITPTISPESCPGQADASIELEILDVETPYTISWTGPNGFTSTDEDIFNLSPGDYTYTIVANNGCIYSETFTIGLLDPIAVDASVVNSCFNDDTGQISIQISGGVPPYQVLWTGPDGFIDDDLSIIGLPVGDYDLTITDAVGCDFTDSYTIAPTPVISVDVVATDVLCFADSNGTIDLTISGGVLPFVVEWSDADGFLSDEEDLDELPPGEYTYVITDSNNCIAEGMVEIGEPLQIQVAEEVTSPGCADETGTGSITITPEGGTPDYTVTWTGPNGFLASDFSIQDLEPGLYDYTVTDQSGCEFSNSLEILTPIPIEVSGTVSQPLCFGESNGSIDIVVSGGVEPFIYDWSGPDGYVSQEDSIDSIMAGDYLVSVTDALGCRSGAEFSVGQPDELSLTLTPFAASCEDTFDGSIESEVVGGTGAYTYAWTGPNGFFSSAENITALSTGLYNLEVADENDCQVTEEITVDVLFEIITTAGPDVSFCPADLPAIVTGQVSEGDLFFWTFDGDTISEGADLTIDDQFTGTTELILIGSNGICSSTDTLLVEIFENPDVDAGEDFQVFVEEIFTLGGSPTSTDEVTYFWSPSPMEDFENTIANPSTFLLESQMFNVIVTDQNGCSSTDSVFVQVIPDIEVNSGFTPNGDGLNDFWVIDNIELFPNMVVHVFNRWGVEVFESQGYNRNIAWDGNFNGSPLPSGTYYFTIELNDERFPDPITGPLTIHR